MFGGLSVKSGADEVGEKKDGNPSGDAAVNGSGFSFMNSQAEATAPAPAPAPAPAAVSSGFSFITATTSETAAATSTPAVTSTETSQAATESQGSAFSFMTTPAPAEAPNAEAADPGTAAAPVSSFSFLQPSTTTEVGKTEDEATAENSDALPATSGTAEGFSFMQQKTSSDPPSAPAPATDFLATTNAAPPPASQVAPATTGAAAGSGVVFGKAGASKPKKRRTRTNRVGVGAGAAGAAVSAAKTPSRPSVPAAKPTQTPTKTRDAALEATKRAEKFMNEKLQTQAKPTEPTASAAALPSAVPTPKDEDQDDDDIFAAARAAAEKAHQIETEQKKPLSFANRFGGMFRSNSGGKMARSNSISKHESGEGVGSTSSHNSTSRPQTSSAGVAATANTPATQPTHEERHRPSTTAPETKVATSTLDSAEQLQEEENVERTQALKIAKQKEDAIMEKGVAEAIQALSPVEQTTAAPTTVPSSTYQGSKSVPADPSPKATATTTSASSNTLLATFQAGGTRATVTPAPKKKTATDKFHTLMQIFAADVDKKTEKLTQIRQQRAGLLEESFVATAKERLAQQQKSAAEAQQLSAAEAEDFELADQLQATIDQYERDLDELKYILINIGKAVEELDAQKRQQVNSITECFSNIQVRLKEMQQEQEADEGVDDADAMKRFSLAAKQISAENERLQQDFKHLERELSLVQDERESVDNAIAEQAGEYTALKEQTMQKLETLEEEISELRKVLASKQNEAAKLRDESYGHDNAIARVRVKFSRQLLRVEKKEATVRDNREDWELEKKAYEANKEQHDAEVKEHSEALLAREQLLDNLSKEVEMADTFESLISREIGLEFSSDAASSQDTTDGDNDSTGSDDDLAQLQVNVVKCEAAVQEAKQVLKAASSALTKLEEETDSIRQRLPQLEEAKKAAAKQRDFKAAAAASKEIKEFTARLLDCESELSGEAAQHKVDAENQLSESEAKLEQERCVAHSKEKEVAKKTMKRLADHIQRLQETKGKVCGNRHDEATPATDDQYATVQNVGAIVLDRQIEALKMEGETYGEKYGGWEELLANIQVENKGKDVESDANEDEGGNENTVKPDTLTGESNDDQTGEPEDSSKETTDQAENVEPISENDIENEEMAAAALTEKMFKFQALSDKLKGLEAAVEMAVEEEDFEEAARIDEEQQELMTQVQDLQLTDVQKEEALQLVSKATDDDSNENADGQGDDIPSVENVDTPVDDDNEKSDDSYDKVEAMNDA